MTDLPELRAPLTPSPIRTTWHWVVTIVLTPSMELLRRTPVGAWLHRRLRAGLEISSTEIPLRRGHADLDGLVIAFLSDLHAGLFMTEEDLVGLAERVAALKPDLVCFGGDLVNTAKRDVEAYERMLEILDPPLGIFAVPGNHEHYHKVDVASWERWLEGHGVRVLVNEGARLDRDGASLWLAGVDDLDEGRPDVERALEGRGEGEPVLLLSHHPDVFPRAAALGVDLQLSGHTHGGQIKLFGWAPITHSIHGYAEGAFERDGSRLYVGRGVGVTTLPLRIGVKSEVAMLRLSVS